MENNQHMSRLNCLQILNIRTHSVHKLFWNEVFNFACGELLQHLSLVSLSNFHGDILFEFRPMDLS